jgi:hypothetical protein
MLALTKGVEPDIKYTNGSDGGYWARVNPGNGSPPSERHLWNAERKASESFKNGIPLEAIQHMSCSENMYRGFDPCSLPEHIRETYDVELVNRVRENLVERPKNRDWFTWAPYVKGPRSKKVVVPKTVSKLVIHRYFVDSATPEVLGSSLKISRYKYGS